MENKANREELAEVVKRLADKVDDVTIHRVMLIMSRAYNNQ